MHRMAYLESEILSASPLRLVELLYRGAIEAASQAFSAAKKGDALQRAHHVNRAHAILTELSLSLNHAAGGELSRDLAELYDYLQRRLTQASIEQSAEPISDVIRILGTLLEAWEALSNISSSSSDVSAYQNGGQLSAINLEGARINSLG